MFIGHMIELLDDFKELIKSQIDEIIETHDNVDHGNYPHNTEKNGEGNQKSKQTLAIPDNNRIKSIVNKNVPHYRNPKKGLLKDREEIPKSVY